MNFVVGHLRSGTAFMAHLLNAAEGADAEWEALFPLTCYMIDPACAAYYEGRCSGDDIRELIRFYQLSKRPLKVDSFWRLSWILPPLLEEYPDAKFIHIVRNPRENVRAAYNDTDVYGDAVLSPVGQLAFMRWCVENDPAGRTEKQENLFALNGGPAMFHAITTRRRSHPRIRRPDWDSISRFEKTCAYWTEAQRLCIDTLSKRKEHYLRVRLEDLNRVESARPVFEFMGLEVPSDEKIAARIAKKVNTAAANDPHWVNVRSIKERAKTEVLPVYDEWSRTYKEALEAICGETARECGYD